MKKNYFKVVSVGLTSLWVNVVFTGISFATPEEGLTSAKTEVINQIKPIINTVLVPIIDVFLAGCLVFAIGRAVMSYKKHQEFEMGWILLLVIGIILISTFPTWGWKLIPSS